MRLTRIEIYIGFLTACLIGSVIGFGLAPVRAQQPAPAPDYTITLNGQEWYLIGEALADRPFKQANPVLTRINQQITAIAMQRQKEEAEAAAKAKAEAEKPKTDLQGNPDKGFGPAIPADKKPE